MDPRRVAGFATMLGGAESHTTIMARSLGLPAVLGVAGLIGAVRTGDAIVIDGGGGRVVVNPSRSEEHTSELQSLMRNSYALFSLQKKKNRKEDKTDTDY